MQRFTRLFFYACTIAAATVGTPVATAEPAPAYVPVCTAGGLATATLVNLDDAGNVAIAFVSRVAEIQNDADDDLLAPALLRLSVKLLNTDGDRIWQYSYFTVTSNDIASASGIADDVVPATDAGASTRLARFYPAGLLCEGLGVVEASGQRYLFIASGIAGADGDTGKTDQTIVKIWIVGLNSGTVAATHVIRGRPGRNTLLPDSAILDYDNDGDDELMVVHSAFVNETDDRSRFRLFFETYDLLTGEPEQSFETLVSDRFVNDNAPP